jgi:endonuclease-3 related protein
MFSMPTAELRAEMLTQNGIGPETADAILLYAGHHEAFVVDAYARRILERHEAIQANAKYDHVRTLFERALEGERIRGQIEAGHLSSTRPIAHAPTIMSAATKTARAGVYNELHGLLVQLGKQHCYKHNPDCGDCPLSAMLSETMRRKLAEEDKGASAGRRRPFEAEGA